LSEEAIAIVAKRREEKEKRRGANKEVIRQLNRDFQRQVRRDKEIFIKNAGMEVERTNKKAVTRDQCLKIKEMTGKLTGQDMEGCGLWVWTVE